MCISWKQFIKDLNKEVSDHNVHNGAAALAYYLMLRERAELTGGGFSVQSTPGQGTAVRVSWPVEA
jgi:nitrate/nitrite-specific signal transduction histidine kinase